MSVPMMFLSTWLLLGMLTTLGTWAKMGDEFEMAIELEEDEEHMRGAIRFALIFVFVLCWPLVIAELAQRKM